VLYRNSRNDVFALALTPQMEFSHAHGNFSRHRKRVVVTRFKPPHKAAASVVPVPVRPV
jgi:hypothetical protein